MGFKAHLHNRTNWDKPGYVCFWTIGTCGSLITVIGKIMVHIVYMKEIILAEPFFLLCVNGPLESQSIKEADVLGR